MTKCSFCGQNIEIGTGSKFIKTDGAILDFCSSKCKKNKLKLKRNPAHQKWVSKKKRGKR